MQFAEVSNQELLSRLDRLVQSERKMTHMILCHINEVESRRLYAELGFDSMFKYLTRHCGYGEDSAYRRLQAARLLKKTPEIAEKIEHGALNLTQLTQVQKCLNQEKRNGSLVEAHQTLQILEQIEKKSSYETKKVLALQFNQPIQLHEAVKPQRDETIRLELTLTSEQMQILEQVKNLLSHTLPEGRWADVFTHLAKKLLQKTLGQKRSSDDTEKAQEATFAATRKQRSQIKSTIRRRLLKKANYCCEFIDPTSKNKCQSTYQLQVDHRIPLARYGSNAESNLRILCRTHNLLAAKKWGL